MQRQRAQAVIRRRPRPCPPDTVRVQNEPDENLYEDCVPNGVAEWCCHEVMCTICLDAIHDPVVPFVCSHAFCRTCVRAWRDQLVHHHRRFTCPMCRADARDSVRLDAFMDPDAVYTIKVKHRTQDRYQLYVTLQRGQRGELRTPMGPTVPIWPHTEVYDRFVALLRIVFYRPVAPLTYIATDAEYSGTLFI